jgi:hypothetical protein
LKRRLIAITDHYHASVWWVFQKAVVPGKQPVLHRQEQYPQLQPVLSLQLDNKVT